jgi:integrase
MIKKSASGKYTVRIYHKGHQVAMRTMDTKKAAQKWEAAQKLQLQLGSWVDPNSADVSLGELISQFNIARKGAVAEHTWDTDEANLRLHVPEAMKRQPVALVSPMALEQLFVALIRVKARATVSRVRNSISSLFSWAEASGVVHTNPVAKAKLPRGTGEEQDPVRPFSQAQLDMLLSNASAISPQLSSVIEFLSLTGLRWGELAALRVSAIVDLPFPALIVSRSKSSSYAEKNTKSGRTRRVPLIDRAVEIAETWSEGKEPGELLFTGARGGQLHGRNYSRAVDWTRISNGHRVQDLRHTAATMWLQAGVDIKTVSTWLGHSDTSITLRIYVHWMESDSDTAGIERLRAARREAKAGAFIPSELSED